VSADTVSVSASYCYLGVLMKLAYGKWYSRHPELGPHWHHQPTGLLWHNTSPLSPGSFGAFSPFV
jgi:hypothetical protein